MTAWMLISTLFAADAPKAVPAKVYVVYVTVVEIDSEGSETVLFTPKVQTTGNPAGATVEHVDGRTFEFNCQMAASTEPALERPRSTSAAKKPFLLTVGSTERKPSKPGLGLDQPGFRSSEESPVNESQSRALKEAPAKAVPLSQVSATGSRRYEDAPAAVKRSPPLLNPLPRDGGEGTKQKPKAEARPAGEYFVRTYDVSALLDAPDDKPPADAHFEPVIQTIKAFAEVESWDGPAAIKPFVSTKSLVVKQTAAGHAAVAEALSQLKSDK